MQGTSKSERLLLEAAVQIIPRKQVLKSFPNGEISLELGADGVYLRFDCDCLDALPYCQAQCCAMPGTVVFEEEAEEKGLRDLVEIDFSMNELVMVRDSDGFCGCLNRETRLCEIYGNRPDTCKRFHCTRGADARGWKLPNRLQRQSNI